MYTQGFIDYSFNEPILTIKNKELNSDYIEIDSNYIKLDEFISGNFVVSASWQSVLKVLFWLAFNDEEVFRNEDASSELGLNRDTFSNCLRVLRTNFPNSLAIRKRSHRFEGNGTPSFRSIGKEALLTAFPIRRSDSA